VRREIAKPLFSLELMILRRLTLFVILGGLSLSTVHAEPPPRVRAEVEYLLESIDTSGCTFLRNGSWYSGASAKAHLRTKYDYLASRDLIATTEDFIDKGATKSSRTGTPYKVRCRQEEPVESKLWLRAALARYRASVPAPLAK
jgi:hypothetical protein